MSLPIFSPAKGPDFPADRKRKARTLSLTLGDGYSERAGDGLNSLQDSIPLTWSKLTKAEADYIDNFLTERGGSGAFLWTQPRGESPQKWICTEWNRPRQTGAYDKITATFQEVFDLDD